MGQAKARGTREERVAKAIEEKAFRKKREEEIRQAVLANMTEEEKEQQRRIQQNLAMMFGLATSSTTWK